MTDALFDLPEGYEPPPPPEELSRGEKRRRLVERRIRNGEHPLGRPVLLRNPELKSTTYGVPHESGLTCGQCKFRVQTSGNQRTYPKCWYPSVEKYPHPRDTGCESSDIRAWWPACRQYEPKEGQ